MEKNGSDTNHIKAVIFDYGEVLCHRPSGEELRQMASILKANDDSFRALWERNRPAFDRGDLAADAYWSMFAKDAGTTLDPRQLEHLRKLDVEMWAKINPIMVDWAQRLRAKGFKIGILSNMHPDMVEHCRASFPWLNDFHFQTFSADVRMVKPDPAIYRHTLDGLGVSAREALFIDDREPNIVAARKLGINAIRFLSVPQLRDELEKMKFPVLPAVN
ncbi:MAG: haloacid dehalogenase superfamily, subfamily variant 3 with third motif having or [Acidobacteriaceae bacterium]|jgi:putative hydrolase of the HAD superfamily|nr:haloacid dehalogenase superfamily, subfamily variant 3 with third motif having or [Acidobacteriaceae bacterium]